MKKKNKNPLYVVKGKDVFEAKSWTDLVIKKLNLEASVMVARKIFFFLLELVENFTLLQVVKSYIDEVIKKIENLKNLIKPRSV